MKLLGYALRYHNQHNPQDQIILRDVMNDVVNFETDRPKGRSAAQNHFLFLLTLGTTIERHKTSARGDGDLAKVDMLTRIQTSILQVFDIPQGILIGLGYNVLIADEGARYSEKERRHACHSALKDFTTTLTETQGGTGGQLHNFDDWDIPLAFQDGRPPDKIDVWNNEEPPWVRDEHSNEQGTQDGSSPAEGPQSHASTHPRSTLQPKKMPRSTTSGGATSTSAHSAFRTGPGSAPGPSEPERDEDWTPTVDWMKRTKPSSVEIYIHAAEDYANQE